ncbi:thioesterase II family protein [Streptomyces sp. NBC_01431]|uniref:thioesterase II family protein n=1 Tax=Streptomyces sp. NBC_01431 TaxID=2903863 RepID=UPI002E34B828|nr:alpha/beta fold hydrolase [Streptomyces sp. NBC_01431]
MTVTTAARTPWFMRHPAPRKARKRLVCLPHAGGTATFFHSWAGAVGEDVEVLATRYPGRQDRLAEPCPQDMAPLADAVAEELAPFLDVPVVLFGHSMGASLGYEVALRLGRSHPGRVAGLLVSAREAPHCVTPKEIHLGSDDEVVAEVKRLGGDGTDLLDDPDIREIVLPSVRGDFRISGTYRAAAPVPVDCPVFGYVGDRDAGVSESDMRRWAEVSTGDFGLLMLPGGHFYLATQRDALLKDISVRIA